jgi:hypothetical protein
VTRHKWKLVLVRLEIVLILTKIGAWFAPNIPLAQKLFLTHTMELLGVVGHVESHLIPFGDTDNLDSR